MAAIARPAGDPQDLETLDAYRATGSLRRAIDVLHLHHSSVARRPAQLSKTLRRPWASNSPGLSD